MAVPKVESELDRKGPGREQSILYKQSQSGGNCKILHALNPATYEAAGNERAIARRLNGRSILIRNASGSLDRTTKFGER